MYPLHFAGPSLCRLLVPSDFDFFIKKINRLGSQTGSSSSPSADLCDLNSGGAFQVHVVTGSVSLGVGPRFVCVNVDSVLGAFSCRHPFSVVCLGF